MPDVNKGKPHMTEEYFEKREEHVLGNYPAVVDWGDAINASTDHVRCHRYVINKILDELETPLD